VIYRGAKVQIIDARYQGTGTVLRLWAETGIALVSFDDDLPREVTFTELEVI
jgi:hypothetical protein